MSSHLTLCEIGQLREIVQRITDPGTLRALMEYVDSRLNRAELHVAICPTCPALAAHAEALVVTSWDAFAALARHVPHPLDAMPTETEVAAGIATACHHAGRTLAALMDLAAATMLRGPTP